MTRKLNKYMVTSQLKDYVNKDLGRVGEYARIEVHNKIDSLMKKGDSTNRITENMRYFQEILDVMVVMSI